MTPKVRTIVSGKSDYVIRTKFNLHRMVGEAIEFKQDAVGQVLIVLDMGEPRIYDGDPILITVVEEPLGEPISMSVFSGEDWFNPVVNEYLNWYYKVRVRYLIVEERNKFRLRFCNVTNEEEYTPDLIVEVHEPEVSEEDKEVLKSLEEDWS